MVNRIALFIEDLSEKRIILILLGITFGLRLYAVLMAKGISYDGAGYGFMARDFLSHHLAKGLSSPLHPFYPFLIWLISPNAHYVEIAGRLISLFFGTITLIPVFYFVKEAIGQKAAFFSGLFYSVHAYLVTYSGMLLSESTYWGLLTFSVYFFWRGLRRKKILECAASGACLGLSYLTRPEGIGYLIVFVLWIITDSIFNKESLKKFLMTGTLILGFFIFAFPYMWSIRQEMGQWLISKKGMASQSQVMKWVEVNESSKEAPQGTPEETSNVKESHKNEASKDSGGLKSEKVIGQPKPSIRYFNLIRTGRFILQFFPATLYHYFRAYHFALWLFLFFGLIRRRGREIKEELFLASLVFFHLVSLSTFTGSTIRFSVPLIPVSLFWAGAGVLEVEKYLVKIRLSTAVRWVSFLVFLTILVQLPESLRPVGRNRADQKAVGLWLRENTPQGALIMSNSPIEAFYAEREFVLLPMGLSMKQRAFVGEGNRQVLISEVPGASYQDIIQFARKKKVRYIMINKNTHELNPDFERSIRSTDLKEFYRFKEKNMTKSILYEVIY